jgi:hypothetical protein
MVAGQEALSMRARTALFSLLLLAVAFSCGEHASAATPALSFGAPLPTPAGGVREAALSDPVFTKGEGWTAGLMPTRTQTERRQYLRVPGACTA